MNTACALHQKEWTPIISALYAIGHIPRTPKRTDTGWMLVVEFMCGETAPMTLREVELLGF